jgi:hypothetical protein
MDATGPQPVGALFSDLIEDVETFVRAELRLQRAKAVVRLVESRAAILMLVVAAMIGQAVVTALLVGIVLALSPRLGDLNAAVIVALVATACIAVLVVVAIRRLDRATQIAPKP